MKAFSALSSCLFALLLPAPPLSGQATEDAIQTSESESAISLQHGNSPILTYHKAEVAPPEGVDPAYRRSGFVYPLHAPSGGIVTGIHPDDHYHHLGLWHAWVNTKYGEATPDFWNLKKRTGRIRFAKVEEVRDTGFTVSQEQVAYLDGPDKDPTVILAETLSIDASVTESGNYVIDYELTQKNVGDQALEFPAYRYGGGIAYRAPHSWGKDNSDYLTSEGLDRTNSHATRARWVAMSGPAENGNGEAATVAILCHPENHDAPQRIRTWDKGPVFFNYVPVQETAWEIKPGGSATFRYRLIIADGKPDAGNIDSAWKSYGQE